MSQCTKRTSRVRSIMSALCRVWTAPGWQEESSRSSLGRCSKKASSFNQLIGAVEQLRRDGHTKRFCSLQVDDQLEFCRLLNWQIRRTGASKNLIDVGRCLAPRFVNIMPIRQQSAIGREVPVGIDCW